MSDMPRPTSLPITADHAQHDVLLVSQLASGDPLDPPEAARAASLVAGCAECAELDADLRTLASAVAWEPIPPRRRDFRLSAEQAERAQGSRLQRLMRQLALPQASGLRPLAAGVMSLGFVLVLAGSFWPGDLIDDNVQQELAAPAVALPSVRPSDTQQVAPDPAAAASSPSALVDNVAKSRDEPPMPGFEASTDQAIEGRADGRSGLDATADELAQISASDDLTMRETSGQTATGSREEDTSGVGESLALEALTETADIEPGATPVLPALAPDVGLVGDAEIPRDVDSLEAAQLVPEASPQPAANERAVDTSSVVEAPAVASDGGAAGTTLVDNAAPVDGQETGPSIATATMSIGLGLIVAGLILWLLVWVARRRSSDRLTG